MDATGDAAPAGRELGVSPCSFGDGDCTDEMTKLAGAAADGLLCSQAGIPPQAADKKFGCLQEEINVDRDHLRADHLRRRRTCWRVDDKANPRIRRNTCRNWRRSTTRAPPADRVDDKGDRKNAKSRSSR